MGYAGQWGDVAGSSPPSLYFCIDRVINHLGLRLALHCRRRFRKNAVLTANGTLMPTRDRTVVEQSKGFCSSTNHQVDIDSDKRLGPVRSIFAGP
ncbi:hypothetical protein Y717_00905 [Streptomyces scopuliridis RB72]|uniref:Uncharacterized protein n=1 Tax=Streptomyces scopuliridis RB72 TaxID=1440053 RepID=A0A2T7T8Y3_9ACTN|nr:hypothetical protein Y717_00905 [Streptomyces scopuliridis RB72]